MVDELDHAVPIARALVAGGLPVIELTLRTPVALAAIERIAGEVPEILIGAGTIVDAGPGQAGRVSRRAVPGLARQHTDPAAAMSDTGLPHLPGVATVSEILTALEAGYTELKFFPAEASGGADYLKSVSSPDPRRAVLPYRRDLHRERRPVPRAAERRLRRRLLDHAVRRCRGAATGHASPNWLPPPRRSNTNADPNASLSSSIRRSIYSRNPIADSSYCWKYSPKCMTDGIEKLPTLAPRPPTDRIPIRT